MHDASPVPLDMTSLFTQYLSTLQATQTNSTELLTDAQQVLAQANLYLASTTPSNSTPTNQLHANGNEMAGSGNETHGNVTKARNGEETNQDFGDSSFSDVFNTSVREEAQSNLKGVHSQRDAEKPQEVVSTNEHQEVWSREQEEAGSYHHGSEEGMGLEELEREKQKRQASIRVYIEGQAVHVMMLHHVILYLCCVGSSGCYDCRETEVEERARCSIGENIICALYLCTHLKFAQQFNWKFCVCRQQG